MDLFCNLVKNSNNDQLDLINNEIYKMNKDNEEYWDFMIENSKIDSDIILKNLDKINISFLIKRQKLNEKVLKDNDFLDYILENNILDDLIKDQILDSSILEFYLDRFDNINWDYICKYQNISIEFMEKHIDKINWDLVSENQFMTLEFICKNMNEINWILLSQNVKLEFLFNESFLELFSDKNIWDILIWSKNISKEYLIENLDKLNYEKILELLEYKTLDLDVIHEIINKFDYPSIYNTLIKNQSLSLNFINENLEKFNLDDIIENQPITIDFIKLHQKDINIKKLSYNDNLTENLLLDVYEIKENFNELLDWDYISEYCFLTKKSIQKIKEINKKLLLNNINIDLD